MRSLFRIVLGSLVVLFPLHGVNAQTSPALGTPVIDRPLERSAQAQVERPELQLLRLQQEQSDLRIQQVAAQQTAKQDETLKKQVDLLQKQIETQQKMIVLLQDQMKKQGGLGTPVESLEAKVITLEARSKQAAQRDVDLAQAVDKLTEQRDADQRFGASLPPGLKELFLPSGTNETILNVTGALAFGYSKMTTPNGIAGGINGGAGTFANPTPNGFYFGEFTPDFFLKINDWIFMEAEIAVSSGGAVTATFAQADFLVNDYLTIIAGKFVTPIGWYNERINNPWINKLPNDAPGGVPLLWAQVLPPMSTLGLQARGSFYLCDSPIKMEYAAYFGNGLNLTPATPGAPTANELANLENMEDTDVNILGSLSFGGRLGLWWPEMGLAGGVSGMYNGPYVNGSNDAMVIWAVDFNYHKGNWDFRAEYGMNFQQAQSFLGNNIRREGGYAQIAYRPWDAPNKYLQSTELVYRFSFVDFQGIDPTTLDLTTFATPLDVPIRRTQHEFGIGYYFTPRMAWRFAYQINNEPGNQLHDNQFITEFAWGW